jgi:hypothetical protein
VRPGCTNAISRFPLPRPVTTSRFFAKAQPHVALGSAPSASAATSTTSASARPQSYGTVRRANHAETNKGVWSAGRPCHLFRLAAFARLSVNLPPRKSQMLRLWQSRSRCPTLPSQTEKLKVSQHTRPEHGTKSSPNTAWKENTLSWLKESTTAFTSEFRPSLRRTLPIIMCLLIFILMPTSRTSTRSSRQVDTLDLTPAMKSKILLVPFSHLPCRCAQNQTSRTNSVLYTISPIHTTRQHRHPSIQTSTPAIIHVPGAPSKQSAWLFPGYPQDPKPQCVMLQQLIPPSQHTKPNGLVWLFGSKVRIAMPSTLIITLVSLQPEAFMVIWQMPGPTFSGRTELVCYQNGWTTTFSSIFDVPTSIHTMPIGRNGSRKSRIRGARFTLAAGYGFRARLCQTESMRSSTRTVRRFYEIFQRLLNALQSVMDIAIAMTILILYQISWASNGNRQRQYRLGFLSPTSVLCGTSVIAQSQSLTERSTNIWQLLTNGKENLLTPSSKFNDFMENCYMSHWLSQWVVPTSPALRPCWGSFTTVCLFHAHLHNTPLTTLNGGNSFFGSQLFHDQYHNQHPSSTWEHILTPALVSASLSWLESIGEHGSLSQDGKVKEGTSDGPRQLVSSFWSDTSYKLPLPELTSRSTGTTSELSKGGGRAKAEIDRLTSSSSVSMTYCSSTMAQLGLPPRPMFDGGTGAVTRHG